MLVRTHRRRRGATVVEAAIVLPLTFFLILGLIIGGMGIYRYQQVASLARQGARYLSTHGAQYRKDAGQPVGTPADWKADMYNNELNPPPSSQKPRRIVALDPAYLSIDATWPAVVNQPGAPDNWQGSKVTVKVTYQWLPDLYLIGPINLKSESTMPITN